MQTKAGTGLHDDLGFPNFFGEVDDAIGGVLHAEVVGALVAMVVVGDELAVDEFWQERARFDGTVVELGRDARLEEFVEIGEQPLLVLAGIEDDAFALFDLLLIGTPDVAPPGLVVFQGQDNDVVIAVFLGEDRVLFPPIEGAVASVLPLGEDIEEEKKS